MSSTCNRAAEPALLQRLISETFWEIKKATTARDEEAVCLAEREMTTLLDQLADHMIVGADVIATNP